MNTSLSLAARVADLQHHFDTIVLPLWTARGWNGALRLPYDSICAPGHATAPVTRYRTMACARQLYVFSASGDATHADVLFQSLCANFADTARGGWHYSIGPDGAPRERVKDLYTHAFVIFACAEYFRRSGNRDALDVIEATIHVAQTRFATDAGVYNAALSDDFTTIVEGPLQNPVMHLTEAYLAVRAIRRDAWLDDALTRIAEQMVATFVHRPSGCIAELPAGSAHNRLEPGHQFEWCYLTASAPEVFDDTELRGALRGAFSFAQRHGVAAATGGVCAALDEAGRVIDASERIWAQTEYARALAVRRAAPSAERPALAEQLALYAERFLRDYGWVEVIAENGDVLRPDMPSTTPYHLKTCYLARQSAAAAAAA
jgi:mannose/cellobiose epimerase-like protein (N-acyl-D-glucosamine 2-epimerase family)